MLLAALSLFALGCSLERRVLLPELDSSVGFDATAGPDGRAVMDARLDADRVSDARSDGMTRDARPVDAAPDASADAMTDTGAADSGGACTDCESCPDYSPCGAADRCFNGIAHSTCGAGGRCFDGECVLPCATHDNGSETCATLCGWCLGTCEFTWSDLGRGESCGATDTPGWCHCSWD